jgi:FlaA1/EpsC-like NDP-sugar epimerase
MQAPPTKTSATPPSKGPSGSLLGPCLVHGAALAAACSSSAVACWAVGEIPAAWSIGGLVFGRTAAALAFRLDRLRWSEWGERDARMWFLATLCGSGLAAALASRLLNGAVLRILFVEALVYFVGGLLLADALRSRRQRSRHRPEIEARRCLVYGSRGSGRRLAQGLLNRPDVLEPFAYLDDDPGLTETVVDGLPVLGCLEDLARLAKVHEINDILAAEPSEDLDQAADEAGVQVHYRRIDG